MEVAATHILLINCPDQPGLVYIVSKVLYQHRLNIISNGEFVEREFSHFFMRTEFSGEVNTSDLHNELQSILPPGAECRLTDNRKKRIVILATKEYHCLGDLLMRHEHNDLNVEIAGVISNYTHLQNLTEKFGVPFYFVDHQIKPGRPTTKKCVSIAESWRPIF